MAVNGFLFGGKTGLTADQLAQRRKVLDAMALRGVGTAPKNVGEGINAIGQALLYRGMLGDVDRGEAEARDRRDAIMNPLLGGGTASMVDPNASASAAIPDPEAAGELAATDPGIADMSGNDIYSGFMDTVRSGGVTNPYALAAIASTGKAESGWDTKNANRSWSDPSESGAPGMAGGIMSWRSGRLQGLYDYAASKGEKAGAISPQTQGEYFLREDPNLIARLNSAQSVEEAQSLMNNAWKFAGYNRPGGEAGRRMGYANAYLPQFQGAGNQVASLDPSAGMSPAAAAIETQAPGSGAIDGNAPPAFDPGRWGDPIKLAEMPPGQDDMAARLGAQASAYAPPSAGQQTVANALAAAPQKPQEYSPAVATVGNAMAGRQQAAPPLPPPQNVGPAPQVAGVPAQAPQQVAGNYPPAPAPASSGPTLQQLYGALSSPDITASDRAILGAMIEQKQREQQQASDPLRQLQIQKARQEIEAGANGAWARLDDGRLYNQRTGEVRNAPVSPNAPPSDLGLNPQYGVDAQGNPVLLQLGKNGQVVQSKMPPNVTLSKEPIKLDAGTHFVLLDPITRQPVGQIPKDNRGVAEATAGGKADAEAKAAFPQVEAAANQMLSSIESLSNDPYLDSMVGSVQGRWLPNVTSDAARVQSKMDQIGGQSFLQAFNSLRGAGQITEQEGQKATAAMGRLNTAQSERDYRDALGELRSVVQAALDRAKARVGATATSAAVPAPSGPVSIGGYTIEAE